MIRFPLAGLGSVGLFFDYLGFCFFTILIIYFRVLGWFWRDLRLFYSKKKLDFLGFWWYTYDAKERRTKAMAKIRHIHKITFRGVLPVETWNRLVEFLFTNNIPYKTFGRVSKTRDDAGLLIYFDSVVFIHNKYIPYKTNRQKITVQDLIYRIKKELSQV